MPRTPDRFPGTREEDELLLETNAGGPSGQGALTYNGSAFQFEDSVGVFNPRTGGGISDATYVTVTTDATLTNERTLAGTANQVILTDGGAGNALTLSTPQDIHAGASPVFTGLELTNTSTPATPTGAVRLYAVNENGYSRLEGVGPSGIVIRYGRDALVVVRNNSGVAIIRGDALAPAANSNANFVRVVKAKADSDSTLPCIGIAAQDIANGSDGLMMTGGVLSGLDTASISAADGDTLYVSASTAGLLTHVAPAHPSLRQRAAVVINRHGSMGTLFVDPDSVRGNHEGTNLDAWKVGSNTAGAKDVMFRNGNDLTLRANPTAARVVTIPDVTGTLSVLTSSAPVDVSKSAASSGSAADAAKADHKHDISTAAAVSIGAANAEGSASTLARSDHTHAISSGAVSNTMLATAAANTVKANATASTASPSDLAVGTNTVVGRVAGNIVAAQLATGQVANNAIDNTKAAQMAANTVKANATAGTANQADLAVSTNTVVGRVGGNIVAAALVDAQVAANTLTNAKLATMAQSTIKGRAAGAGTGDATDLTAAQATAILDTFTSGLKGLAPSSGGGTTNFLRADGAWVAPPGGGGGISEATHEDLDTLTHAIAETSYVEVTRASGRVSKITIWDSASKTKKVREHEITRSAGLISQIVVTQYDGTGAAITGQILTHVVSRSGGRVSSVTTTQS